MTQRVCTVCFRPLPHQADFCPQCGWRRAPDQASSAVPRAAQSGHRRVRRHQARRSESALQSDPGKAASRLAAPVRLIIFLQAAIVILLAANLCLLRHQLRSGRQQPAPVRESSAAQLPLPATVARASPTMPPQTVASRPVLDQSQTKPNTTAARRRPETTKARQATSSKQVTR